MAPSAGRRVALMSIHPGYAEAIVSGRKRAEFRKRALAADVDVVLIYATAPVKAIIGWFTVCGTVRTTPEDIWRRLHPVGGVSQAAFAAYYSGCDKAVALLVGEAGPLTEPVALSELDPSPATPQSFNYVSYNILAQVAGRIECRRSDRSLRALRIRTHIPGMTNVRDNRQQRVIREAPRVRSMMVH